MQLSDPVQVRYSTMVPSYHSVAYFYFLSTICYDNFFVIKTVCFTSTGKFLSFRFNGFRPFSCFLVHGHSFPESDHISSPLPGPLPAFSLPSVHRYLISSLPHPPLFLQAHPTVYLASSQLVQFCSHVFQRESEVVNVQEDPCGC